MLTHSQKRTEFYTEFKVGDFPEQARRGTVRGLVRRVRVGRVQQPAAGVREKECAKREKESARVRDSCLDQKTLNKTTSIQVFLFSKVPSFPPFSFR